eukprot:jgi/Mesvir1/18607/Mv17116-RA.1
MTDVYVMTLYSANTASVTKTASTDYNEWTVQVPPDANAPILDGRWKAHVLFASVKGFQPKGSRRVIGVLCDAFPCSSGPMTPIATEIASGTSAADYAIINQQNYLAISDPYILKNGGSIKIRVCHLDTVDPFTAAAAPTLTDWTIVLRFELFGRRNRA